MPLPMFDLTVRVTPRSSKSGIEGSAEGGWKVRVMASPTDGQANEAVIEVVAKALQLSKSCISLERGDKGRIKVLRVEGLEEQDAHARLASAASQGKKPKVDGR